MKGNCFEFAKSGSCKFGTGCKFHHIRSTSTRPDLGSSRKFNTPRGSQNGGPIDVFFSQFPCFGYNTTAPVWDEFEFLCQFNEWDDDDYKKRQAKREFKDALIREFGTLYGTDADELWSWQKLCEALQISPVSDDVKVCRQHVLQLHVNLVDLVDYERTGKRVQIFSGIEDLRQYTKSTGKIFPKDEAKAQGPLKCLLKRIFA